MKYPSVRRWLLEHTSLDPALLEGAGFETMVAERVSAMGAGSEAAYVTALDGRSDEADRLTGGIAVPETWFFRYPQSFRLLGEYLERRRGGRSDSLRMRSIGCASGEEAYSMAMAALHAGWPPDSIRIDAYDRNSHVLRRAEAGEYGASSIRAEIPIWAVQYLRRSGGRIEVDSGVRRLVRFVRVDVIQSGTVAEEGPYDVTFCRNLLIYLNADARSRLLQAIIASMSPDALLFVGHAEPLLCTGLPLRPISAPHAFALEPVASARAAEISRPTPRVEAPWTPMRPIAELTPPRPVPQRVESADTSDTTEPTLDRARCLADAGRAGESESMARAILARNGPSAGALELLGMIRMAANDAPGARVFFEQAVYLEPTRAASILQLAVIGERQGDPRRAAALWDRARRLSDRGREEPPR